MRIVLDSNILARVAMSSQGVAAELLTIIRTDHLLVISLELSSELTRILGYERVQKIHQLESSGIDKFVEQIEQNSLVTSLPVPIERVVPHDVDDDVIVATAIAGNVDVICSRDKHLHHPDVIEHCSHFKIRLLNDIDLLNELRALDNKPAE